MGRQPRIHVSYGFYHVILRDKSRQTIFLEPADRAICQSAGAALEPQPRANMQGTPRQRRIGSDR